MLTMTPSQQKAVEFFRSFLSRYRESEKLEITEFAEFGKRCVNGALFYRAILENPTLPENNLLRVLSEERWMVLIGKKGGIEVLSCPDSCKQFAGRRAFGLRFNPNVDGRT